MNKYNNTQQACGSWMQFSKNSRFTSDICSYCLCYEVRPVFSVNCCKKTCHPWIWLHRETSAFSQKRRRSWYVCFFLKPESSGSVRLKAVTDSQLTVTWWNISAADSDCFHIHTHSYKHKHNDGVMLENMLMKDVYALVSWLTLIHFKGAKFNSL